MSGFLSSQSSLLADLSLILSVILGLLAAFGAVQAKRKRFSSHCPLLTSAALANWLPILIVMLPTWWQRLTASQQPAPSSGLAGIAPLAHGVIGAIVQLLMTYTVIRMNWLRSLPPRRTRWLMRAAMGLWLLTLLGGVGVYAVLYIL